MVIARFATFVGLAVLGLAGCSKPPPPEPDVILLHSGRIRGNVYPTGLKKISPLQYYPYLAGYIKKVREEAAATGAQVFVVDLGDSMGGSFAAHVTGSENMTAFFNAAGYDAVLLSNLDASVPETAIQKLKARVLCPFFCPAGAASLPPAGARLDKGEVPLFLLANFYGETESATHPERFPTGFGPVKEGVRPVRDYFPVRDALGKRPENALTVFSWMKFEPVAQPPEPFLGELRKLGVNAILAHRIYGNNEREAWQKNGFIDWKPPVSLNILRNNGGFALARLDLARDGAGWKVLRHELVPMTANQNPADEAVVAAIEPFSQAIQAADFPVCELPEPVSADRILGMYLAALTTVPGTQAVACSRESIRSDWDRGTLRASDVFNSLPWTTGLVQISLSAEQFRTLAASGLLRIAALTGAGEGPVTLTTSQFFGNLIARQPGMEGTKPVSLPQGSEFDFFLAYLKSHPSAVASGLPADWNLLDRSP